MITQYGAYFERRIYRAWYAPWRTRTTWTQISAWTTNGPPATGEVVTVSDLSELPGTVRTIGTVSENGTTVY